MATTAALFGALFAVLIVLELVDAILTSVLDGAAAEAGTRAPRSPAFMMLILIGWLGSTVGLIFHEVAHAAAQAAFGGRPSIVLLKNGGFARSSPWLPFAPVRVIHVLGQNLGLGVIGLAPALLTAAGIGAIVLWASPLSIETLAAAGRAIAATADRAAALDVVEHVWGLVADGSWWMWPLIGVVLLLVAPCMTPSSVDYAAASPALLGYGLAAVAVSGGGAIGALAAAGAALALALALQRLGALPTAIGTALGGIVLSAPVLWLATWLISRRIGYSPPLLIQSGLAVTAMALAFAAAAQALYVAIALVLALFGRPRILWRALRALPGHLLDLVRPFSTCADCGVHYRGHCDGCGRTPAGPPPPKPTAPPPKPRGLVGLLEKTRGERAG